MDHAHHGPISQLKSGLLWLGGTLAILGILAIAAPWAASTVVDYMVGGSLIAAGMATFLGLVLLFEAAAKLTAAFSVPRNFPWGWLLADGLITAVLGGILLTSPTGQTGVYLGVLIGINLLSSGAAFLASGLWIKREIS
ncbi:MAG: DUF308 domain-containing protein [Planctomycetia bacterium]|nr:DUF308 domain-containing protein [Planctomycetia bacterium]